MLYHTHSYLHRSLFVVTGATPIHRSGFCIYKKSGVFPRKADELSRRETAMMWFLQGYSKPEIEMELKFKLPESQSHPLEHIACNLSIVQKANW